MKLPNIEKIISIILDVADNIKKELNYTDYDLSEILFEVDIDGSKVKFKIKSYSEEE